VSLTELKIISKILIIANIVIYSILAIKLLGGMLKMKKYVQGDIVVYAESFEEALELIEEIKRMERDY
jgi:hypothetical protein